MIIIYAVDHLNNMLEHIKFTLFSPLCSLHLPASLYGGIFVPEKKEMRCTSCSVIPLSYFLKYCMLFRNTVLCSGVLFNEFV